MTALLWDFTYRETRKKYVQNNNLEKIETIGTFRPMPNSQEISQL